MEQTGHFLQQLELTELMQELDSFFPERGFCIQGLFEAVLGGDFKEGAQIFFRGITGNFQGELAGMKNLFVTMLILGILSAVVASFVTGFENHQIADIAHMVFYLLMLAILFRIFLESYEIAEGLLQKLTQFCRLVFPALCLSAGAAMGAVTAAGYYEIALLLIFFVEIFLCRVCLPLLPAFMLLVLMNGIWEEGKLDALIDLLEKAIGLAIKCSLAVVTGLGVLQSMVAPVLDGLKRGAAQRLAEAIPGLGNLAEGAAQLVLGSAILVKNSLGLLALLLLAALILIPCLQLFLYGLLLKLGGALVGVAADKRLTAGMLRAGDAVWLLLRLTLAGAVCFFILIAIVTCLTVGRGI